MGICASDSTGQPRREVRYLENFPDLPTVFKDEVAAIKAEVIKSASRGTRRGISYNPYKFRSDLKDANFDEFDAGIVAKHIKLLEQKHKSPGHNSRIFLKLVKKLKLPDGIDFVHLDLSELDEDNEFSKMLIDLKRGVKEELYVKNFLLYYAKEYEALPGISKIDNKLQRIFLTNDRRLGGKVLRVLGNEVGACSLEQLSEMSNSQLVINALKQECEQFLSVIYDLKGKTQKYKNFLDDVESADYANDFPARMGVLAPEIIKKYQNEKSVEDADADLLLWHQLESLLGTDCPEVPIPSQSSPNDTAKEKHQQKRSQQRREQQRKNMSGYSYSPECNQWCESPVEYSDEENNLQRNMGNFPGVDALIKTYCGDRNHQRRKMIDASDSHGFLIIALIMMFFYLVLRFTNILKRSVCGGSGDASEPRESFSMV